ncbi:amino acid ABC transporter permease|uniref:L-cystine transport system permease protein n=1 Tax=Dendrosporobacter quercicolus TaxID=146817 RepID=A0A1G9XFR5_9FIRM|nr:amino acid ABC transporter permease [Dendrosporobacter quercicolus]NSL49677.1 amino acid ABC transporter permease [Dendrosporobacter quercicolus DSM 1736]SDM95672.1 L-cystine transport system permease protein [Dendrosporobacter quercicolus]
MNKLLEFSFMWDTFIYLLEYIPVTLFLAVTSMVLAIIIGLFSAVALVRNIPFFRQLAKFYLLFGRAIPTMVMLYLVYFGLPVLLMAFTDKTGIDTGYQHVPPMVFAILGLTVHTGAYLTEIFRAAILSVDKGQMEAALSVGMTWAQGFYRIIFRQAAVFAVPLLANQFLGLIKSTSIVFTITVIELLGAAKIASAEHYRYLETYLVVAMMYWAVSILFEKLFSVAEQKLSLFKKEASL